MRRAVFVIAIMTLATPVVFSQGITGFTGGTEYGLYYTGSTGDVVGFRFEVLAPVEVDALGAWNADSNGGLSTAHQVGIWDSTQTLVASVTVDPLTGTVIGDWTYAAITPVTLTPGQVYTAGMIYFDTDSDSYISGASGVTTDANVTWINAAYPSTGSLGFAYPANDSSPTSGGRFGPNFTFTVVPVELQSFTIE